MKKYDFSQCAYNLDAIPEEEKCVERFPDLMAHAHIFDDDLDLPSEVSSDKVMRYLIMMFAPNSPIRDAFPDISKRKQAAIIQLNIPVGDNGQLAEGYKQMCMMSEQWVVKRFVIFTHLFKSEDYSIIATAEIRLAEMQKSLLTMKTDKSMDDKNWQEGMERWRKTIVEARERIMDGEASRRSEEEFNFSLKSESLGIMPEEVAKYWREFGEIFPEVTP